MSNVVEGGWIVEPRVGFKLSLSVQVNGPDEVTRDQEEVEETRQRRTGRTGKK